MSPGWNLFNSQDSRIASQAGISTGRQRAEPPPLDYSHAATGSPVLGVNLPKTAGQKHKKYPRFQVEIGGVSFHLFPQVAGGFAFLPYAATLCGTQRMEIRCFKKPFGYSHSVASILTSRHSSCIQFSVPSRAECRQVTQCRVSSASGTKSGTTSNTYFKLRVLSFFVPRDTASRLWSLDSAEDAENARFETQPPSSLQAASCNRK